MFHRRWRLTFLISLSLLMLNSSTMLSDASAQTPANSLLSLGILQESGRLHERLSAVLVDELAKTEHVLSASDLRTVERNCRMVPCLAQIAASRGADMIIWGDVRRSERKERIIDVRIYDRHTRSSYHRSSAGAEEDLESIVRVLGPRILQEFRTPVASMTLGELTTATSNLTVKLYDPAPSSRPTWRIWVASILGAVSLASLSGAIALTALNHGAAPNGSCAARSCVWDYTGLFSAGYALAALSGTGLVLAVVYP